MTKPLESQTQDEEDEEEFVECCRCETKEHPDNMINTDMGYLCECCEGDLR